jgi:hypothetical protein
LPPGSRIWDQESEMGKKSGSGMKINSRRDYIKKKRRKKRRKNRIKT